MRRVLVVDDDPDILATFEAVLGTRPDVEFLGVDNEAAARDALASWAPDVALVDARLGPENGVDLLRLLARTLPTTRRVLMTGFDLSALAALGYNPGDADALLAKDDIGSVARVLGQILPEGPPEATPLLPEWLFAPDDGPVEPPGLDGLTVAFQFLDGAA